MERLASIDLGAHFFFQSLRRPWLDPLMKGLTHVGDSYVVIAVGLLAVIALLAAKRPWTAVAILLSGCLGITISESVKKLVDRQRPPDVTNAVVPKPSSPSFPSGHALGSTAVYGAIGLGASQLMRSRGTRRLVIALGFLLPFLIGVTRLYLGVHFVFDVVGGWTAGVACVLLGHWVDRNFGDGGVVRVT